METRLTRVAVVAVVGAAMALAANATFSQTPQAAAPAPLAPPIVTAPPPAPTNTAAPPSTPAAASVSTNTAGPAGPAVPDEQPATNAVTPPPPAKPTPPPGPPRPVRAPTAVLQVLDKVTAETLAFEAPVGRTIRYKTLLFTVKVCETRGLDDPQPRPSAFVVIESQAVAVPGHAPPPRKLVYHGWMFATGPALHPMEHPIYDAWLISCSAAPPPK